MMTASTISYPTAVAHAVLSFSSAWAIFEANGYIFAIAGFLLYLVNGLLGMVAYGK